MGDKNVMVGMSGGVDSSVAALFLKQQGYNVAGATFRLFDVDSEENSVGDARDVCRQIGIPHYVFDFKDLFRVNVIDEFVSSYERGKTPNPCVNCNRHIKLAAFLDKAKSLGYDQIASGHYASVVYDRDISMHRLRRATYAPKDQSYVLYSLTPEQLSAFITPLGGYTKHEIRDMAEKSGIKTHNKAESQDICFVPDGDYAGFLRRYTGREMRKGSFISENGEVLGSHKGICNYTVGQRKGLGLSFGTPMYVTKINASQNTVTLGGGESLWKKNFFAHRVNWIERPIDAVTRFDVKVRYAHEASPATVTSFESGLVGVEFDTAQRAITPGQSAVFYSGDYVAGGGVIMSD